MAMYLFVLAFLYMNILLTREVPHIPRSTVTEYGY